MAWQFELTDTFASEANYCWVKRAWMPDLEEREGRAWNDYRAIMRKARKWAGYTGVRGTLDNFGDSLAWKPRGVCVVLFAQWVEPEYVSGEKVTP